MRRCFIVTIILLFSLAITASAQQNASFKNRFFLRYTPSSLADPWGAMLPLGLEYGIERKTTVAAEIHLPAFYLIRYPGLLQSGSRVTSDWKLRFELRQYFRESTDQTTPFVALEFTQRWQEYDIEEPGFYKMASSDRYHFNTAHVSRQRTTGAAVFGYRVALSPRFFIEANAGLGIKRFDIDYDATVTHVEHIFTLVDIRTNSTFNGSVTNLYTPVAVRAIMRL